MWNLRSLKMSVMLVVSGVALVTALPVKAQQVILTPAGTMFQPTMMPGTEIGSGQPVPAPIVALDPALPSYDILTPEQLKPGKIIFRGNLMEILAPDDPRISEQMRSGQPPDTVGVFWEATMMGASYQPRHFFLAPPATNIKPIWDGNLRMGTRIPGFWGGEDVIVANDDPRIPENLRAMDLGDLYYWAIDSRSLNPALPSDLFSPLLYTRNHAFMIPGKAAADVRPEAVRAGIEQYQRELAWRNPPPGDSSEIIIVPPVDRRDEIPWMPTIRDDDAPSTLTPEEVAEAVRRGEMAYLFGSSAANQVTDTNLSSQSGPTVVSGGITGAASFSAATASGSGQIPVSAISNPSTVFPTVSQPVIVNQVAPPVTSVTVQASQNPTADFVTTRSAPRNTVPEQLNQGIIDSPLSNSRIFPGMR
jgi:hypothetical protein